MADTLEIKLIRDPFDGRWVGRGIATIRGRRYGGAIQAEGVDPRGAQEFLVGMADVLDDEKRARMDEIDEGRG